MITNRSASPSKRKEWGKHTFPDWKDIVRGNLKIISPNLNKQQNILTNQLLFIECLLVDRHKAMILTYILSFLASLWNRCYHLHFIEALRGWVIWLRPHSEFVQKVRFKYKVIYLYLILIPRCPDASALPRVEDSTHSNELSCIIHNQLVLCELLADSFCGVIRKCTVLKELPVVLDFQASGSATPWLQKSSTIRINTFHLPDLSRAVGPEQEDRLSLRNGLHVTEPAKGRAGGTFSLHSG